MCQNIQFFTHNALGKCFGTWARLIVRFDKCIGIFYFILYVLISVNLINYSKYEYEKRIWTPAVSVDVT